MDLKQHSPKRLRTLARTVQRYTEEDGGSNPFLTAIEGFAILRSDHAKPPRHHIFRPALCITIQGCKWASFGDKRFTYRAGQALVVTVEMPSRGTVSAASPQEPFLGLVIELDRLILQEVTEALGMHLKADLKAKARGAFVVDLKPELVECALRSVRLLGSPEAIPMLYPGIMREICYWLLTGPCGDQILHMTMACEHDQRVIRAIRHLRDRFNQAICMEELALACGMSPATFHRQFKTVTSMTPVQYQKQLRLLEARRLMIASNAKVESAAFEVGYESVSQFSREYARFFGKPPRRDVSAWKCSQDI